MVFIGSIDESAKYIKSSPVIVHEWYEEMDSVEFPKAKTTCPYCKKTVLPFKDGSDVRRVGTLYPWVGCDYQDIEDQYVATCKHCKQQYRVGVLYEQ